LRVLASFAQHSFSVFTGALGRNRSGNNLANGRNVLLEIDVAFLRDQRWISGDTIGESKRSSLANLVKVCRI
jgi:hypothetical protein